MSPYDPNHLRRWYLEKQLPQDQAKIDAARHAVVDRETARACYVHWLSKTGEILHESWVPKSAIELKAHAMKRLAGENALKTELREWMWERGIPSDGTESIEELQNEVLWHKLWPKLPERLQRAHVQVDDTLGEYS